MLPSARLMSTDAARDVLVEAIRARTFPAAVVDVGDSRGPIWQDALGTLTFESAQTPTLETPFDLASLTKVIATTTALMHLVRVDAVRLDRAVADLFTEWRGGWRERVTVRDLLEHASGLSARLVDAPPEGRREFEHEICTMPLEYEPRARSIYSDLGFILLGFLAADLGGRPLSELLASVLSALDVDEAGAAGLTFQLAIEDRARAAPTLPMPDDLRRGRALVGEVHDNYAAALSGVAGHAGLFGTARAVGAFARAMLRAARGDGSLPPPFVPSLVREFTARSVVPGSSRALGWDTMLTTSSCGTRMSPSAFGHVGFTGTSLWIDPSRDRYFVLLTNRACGGGTLDEMRSARRAFHDALAV